MARGLNFVYATVVVGVFLGLSWRFYVDPPAPSDPFSIQLGWAGLGSMLAMLVYVPARRLRYLRRLAPLSAWLNFHIFLGVLGVTFVFFHSLHIFVRAWDVYWANPANINFIAVMIVFSSGIFGRYLYSMLPRTQRGERMKLEDVRVELQSIAERLPTDAGGLLKTPAQPNAMDGSARVDHSGQAARVEGAGLDAEARRLLKRRNYLQRRLTLLSGAQRFFSWWVVLHRPLSAIMYILSVVHVILAYMFTSTLAAP